MVLSKAGMKIARAIAQRNKDAKAIRKKEQETRRLNQGRSNTFGKRPGHITVIDSASRRIAKGKNKGISVQQIIADKQAGHIKREAERKARRYGFFTEGHHQRRTVADDGSYYIKRPESVGANIMSDRSLFASMISEKPYLTSPIPDRKLKKLKEQGYLEVFDEDGRIIRIKDIFDL